MSGPPQWVRGEASRQAHVDLPAGTFEEEHGRDGFAGPASHLYRRHPPTDWLRITGPLRPHALDARRIADSVHSPVTLLDNDDVRVAWLSWPAGAPASFVRDADGDRLYFVHTGNGTVTTEYGPLAFRPGHYVLLPRGTTHRIEATDSGSAFVVTAINGRLQLPDRGLLGRHALFDPAVLAVPEPEPIDEKGEFDVVVTRNGALTTVVYPHHPYDVVGWKGDLAPAALHVDDFRPVMSDRYHLPPSAHTTFEGDGFVVATFAPRPFETDPGALRVPFYHRNVDYDEVIFYHSGSFFSREGIEPGMLTFHPAGIHHGPQPRAVERAAQRGPGGAADEVAINVDARRPLHLTADGDSVSDPSYVDSWHSPPDR